jgi:hypothetical protein
MKKKIHYYLCYCLFFIGILNVQGQGGMGLILEDETYNTLSAVPMSFATNSFSEMPNIVSLKKYCPKVVNQGEIGSCVGWSSGYAAFTIMRAKKENWTDIDQITENAYSALYIYNQVKIGDCYQGSLFSKALEFLKTNGDCLSSEFDYPKGDCDRNPNEIHKIAAEKSEYEVRDYFTLYPSNASSSEKINQVKLSLSEGKPVIIGMAIRENFKGLRKNTPFWNPEIGDKTAAGGHAMVVIGYDEEKNAFEIMNSWSTKWGNDGFFWMKYEDFGKQCVYGYQLLIGKKMIDNDFADISNNSNGDIDPFMNGGAKKSILNLSAEFIFRYPVDYDEEKEKVIFEAAQPRYNGRSYALNCKKNQRFQLLTKKITKDRYVYVFSIDADNQSKVHWPRSGMYSQSFSGIVEGAIVPYNNVEIVIPGKDKGLIKDKLGKDNLFVLYSYKPIKDLMDKIEVIKTSQGDYYTRLEQAFGKRLVPTHDINYGTNMKFSTASKSGGYIVPILLEVNAE